MSFGCGRTNDHMCLNSSVFIKVFRYVIIGDSIDLKKITNKSFRVELHCIERYFSFTANISNTKTP